MWQLALVFGAFLLLPFESAAQDVFRVEKAQKEITLKGYTRSKTAVTVSSEVTGRIEKVNYDVGQTVGDDPFFEVDPTFVNFQIESTRRGIRNLQIALEQSNSRIAYLQKEFKRVDALFKGKSTAATQRDKAAEDLVQAKLEGESIKVRIGETKTVLQELQERKRRHSIHAPPGWVVTAKFIEEGEIIGLNTPLARVADYRQLVIPLSVAGRELAAIKNLPAVFAAYLDNRPVKASINWVNPEFDERTRKLHIQLILREYNGEKRGGLLFSLPLKIATDGLRVPKSAVITRYENPRVKLKGTGEEIQVLILGESGRHFIIAGNNRLAPGMALVNIQP
jgi:multidrug efflux pump subunit AcrA (membrane-fusion protein)